eukprot:TRINITY_DN66683_c10_g1_i2.p1 TRINITY_DN66683_c10_g1~~TRINITY_DN66683_c10_g1_i2.p1  ORF type:complete len:788 (+),score=132.38 TRINITY_DN66683_c10_g1_i2:104-2365(+)
MAETTTTSSTASNFVVEEIQKDIDAGKHKRGEIITRFPPEPNGYLHLGHAKAICLNFGLPKVFGGGRTHLRFDDTNPTKERTDFVNAIKEDVKWLGCDWGDHLHFTSDYFDQLYEWAEYLVKEGKAYVDDQNLEEIRKNRGSVTAAGTNSPFRDRSVEENLDLLRRMKAGEFPNGSRVLRAKIDMASTNMQLRDPLMYRILHSEHHRTGDKWSIYPMYDYAHGQSDAIEGITHSCCSLEFMQHRDLYDWFLNNLPVEKKPRQIEFARLKVTNTVMSKRKLQQLVEEGVVSGWDDPRLPTISGMRRRGFSPEGIRKFVIDKIGVTRAISTIDVGLLYTTVEEDIQDKVERRLAVLDPIKVTIVNMEENETGEVEARNHPTVAEMGSRKITYSREIFIDREDFQEVPEKKFFRLAPGKEVRLRYFCIIKCVDVVKEGDKIVEIKAEWDKDSLGGNAKDGRQVKGTIHWVDARTAISTEMRLYDTLFLDEEEEEEGEGGENDWLKGINKNSLTVVKAAAEPAVKGTPAGTVFQFERKGYFAADPDSTAELMVFNRSFPLRDSYAKAMDKDKGKAKPAAKGGKGGKGGGGAKEPECTDGRAFDIRVGKILEVAKHPDADSLYVEKIDVGEEKPRQIVSGLVKWISVEEFTGKLILVCCNMKPSKLRGVESAGMVLCASTDDAVQLCEVPEGSAPGQGVTLPSLGEQPAAKPQLNKKKVDAILPHFHTNDKGQVQWKEHTLTLPNGEVTSKLFNCTVR